MDDDERYGDTPRPQPNGHDQAAETETQKDRLVRIGMTAKLWHDRDQQAFASIPCGKHIENHALRSKPFKSWLIRAFYKETTTAPGSQAVEDALKVLEAKAMFDGDERGTFLRIAGSAGQVYIDLGDENWRAIEVTESGWKIVAEPPIAFIRSRGMRPLPCPEPGGSLQDLKDLVNLKSEDDFKLLVAWLLAALRPQGPFAVLCINGEQGSAKTTLARLLRRLIDPNTADTRTIPRDEQDLLLAARNGWIINLDNLSELRPWLSDALCRIATGGGFGTRQLYTNTDEVLFDAKRPIIINGIPTLATRPDLADRCLALILPTIQKRAREREQAFWGRFEECAGQILGVLLDCIAKGLASEAAVCEFAAENEIELPRMADAALWAEAAGSRLGWSTGSVLKLFLENQAEVLKHIVDSDPVATAVQDFMKDRDDWEGTSTELLAALNAITPDELHRSKDWPRSARSISEKMRRAAPGIRMVGIGVDTRTLEGKTIWSLYKIGYGNHPTQPTVPTEFVESSPLNGAQGGHGGQESLPNLSGCDDDDLEVERAEREAIQNEPGTDPFYIPPEFDRRGSV